MITATATFTVIDHKDRFIVVDEDGNHYGDFLDYEEALERAYELEVDLDAESERFGDHADPGDYDGDHVSALASVYGDDW